MTESEAVERLVAAFRREMEVDGSLSWDKAARIALVSHPAVEVLRDLVESRIEIESADTEPDEWIKASKRHVEAEERARTVLASLPKEK